MLDTKSKSDKGFKGNLDTVSLLDVFQLLFSGKKSGMLELTDGDSSKKVYLKTGMIVGAESSENEDMLGTLLLKRGKIKKMDLNRALSLHKSSGKMLGQVLIEMGLFSDAEICSCLKMQVEEIIYSLFGWSAGEFIFHEGKSPNKSNYEIALNPMNVIMEATRRMDEWNEMKENLPPENYILYGAVPERIDDEEIRLSREEFGVLTLIDSKRSFKQVLIDSPSDRFSTSKAIHRFISLGLIDAYKPEGANEGGDVGLEAVLRDLLKFHRDIYDIVFLTFTDYMGEEGLNILERVFKICKTDYQVLDRFSGSGGKGVNYEKMVAEALTLPENAIMHKVANSFSALSQRYLNAVKEYLGVNIFTHIMGKLRKANTRYVESRRQSLINYGIEDDVFHLLYLK